MENASKALLIAAGALIAILILTLAVYMFSSMSENAANMYKELEASEISRFNQQFLNYDGRGDEDNIYNPLTIQDVATIVNLAINNEILPKMATEITVEINGCGCENKKHENCTDDYQGKINDFLIDHMNDVKNNTKFKCSVNVNLETTLVDKIVIDKIEQ